jgi:ubiquitin-conjugating enzyme E2 O
LDGTVEVMLMDSSVVILPLERLTRLQDGLEQLEYMWGEDASDGESLLGEAEEETWATNEQGEWVQGDTADGDEWSTDEEDVMEVDEDGWSSSDPTALQSSSEPATSPVIVTPDELMTPQALSAGTQTPDVPKPLPLVADTPAVSSGAGSSISASAAEDEMERYWKRFDILPGAPLDHAFYSSPPAQTSRTFLARLNKEYRVLSSSLPGE